MRRFSYEGDHAEVESYGLRFPQGVPVLVEDAFALKKLEGNCHFKEHAAASAPVTAPIPAQVTAIKPVAAVERTKRKYTRKAA